MRKRIYLDHAATRYPKPAIVLDAMRQFSALDEAAVGRGAYRSSRAAGEIVSRLRREIARWIDAPSDQEISIHSGGTEAINTALFGLLRQGDHVVTTSAEHNSVLRPLYHLAQQGVIHWDVVPVDASGHVATDAVLGAVQHDTRLVAVVHAANVNGAVQPINEIGSRLADRFGGSQKPILFCDAAQTFGHLPLSVAKSHVDALAAPGHKGGCGPLGTGFLFVRSSLHDTIRPMVFGGTGTRSESLEMPNDYPTSFEAGNMNVPALAGWLAGLRQRSVAATPTQALMDSQDTLRELAQELYRRLETLPGVQVVGRPQSPQLPVASVAFADMDAGDAAMILDSEFAIEVRSGLHCAALIHEAIGSPAGGTLRISCAETTTMSELDALSTALGELTS